MERILRFEIYKFRLVSDELVQDYILIVVEALAGLLAQQAAADHLAQQQCGTVLGIAGLDVQGLHDGQAHVQANEVAQSQGTHGMVGPQHHSLVDVGHGSNAGLHQVNGFIDHGDQDLVNHEARSLGHLDGILADLLGQVGILKTVIL